MALTADELVVKIRGDLSDINKKLKQLEQVTSSTTSKVSKNFNKIASVAKLAVGAVVVHQLARAGASLVRFGSHVEEMQAKSGVVFGQFASQVRSDLSEFADTVGRSVFELEEMASTIQDTFVPMGFARGEAAELSVQMAKLATDVASFNNASDAETMRAFQSALVGNHETVRRFGVVITEATIQQELMRMGINKLSKDASNQEKVQARLNILLRGTTDAQGDAARTSQSFANQMKALGGELQNLGVAVITPLLPTLASFVGTINSAVRGLRDFLFNTGLLKRDLSVAASATAQLIQERAKLTAMEAQRGAERDAGLAITVSRQNLIDQEKVIETLQFHIAELERLNKLVREKADAEEREQRVAQDKAEALQQVKMAIEEQKKQQEFLKRSIELGTNAEREAIKVTSEYTSQFALLGEEGKDLEEKLLNLAIANEKLREDMKSTGDEVKNMKPLMEELMNVATSVGQAFENSFIDTLSGTKSALESFRDMSRQLVEEIIRVYTRMAIINPIIRQLFQGEQGVTTNFLDQNFPTASPSNVFSNAFRIGKKALGFAGGGTIQGKRPVIVGERGPEMFIPNVGGRIVPNGALPSGGGGTVINQSLNFATGIQNTVRAEVMNMMPIIQNATLQAVVDQKRRGGAFAQGMG